MVTSERRLGCTDLTHGNGAPSVDTIHATETRKVTAGDRVEQRYKKPHLKVLRFLTTAPGS